MESGERANSWLAKVTFPQWAIVDHTILTLHENLVFLPLFSSEERARDHAASEKITSYELRKIETKSDMLIEFGLLKNGEKIRVCFNQDFTGTDVVGFPIQDVIARLPRT